MRLLILWVSVVLLPSFLSAQKPAIDTAAFGTWPSLPKEAVVVSNDGKYVFYVIKNMPVGGHTLVFQSTSGDWKREVQQHAPYTYPVVLSKDSRYAIYPSSSERLAILFLGDTTIRYIDGFRSFKSAGDRANTWLAVLMAKPSGRVQVLDLADRTARNFEDVLSYTFSNDGASLIIASAKEKDSVQSVGWYRLRENRYDSVWKGVRPAGFTFDNPGLQLAFVSTEKRGDKSITTLWHYTIGATEAKAVFSEDDHEIGDNLTLDMPVRFTNLGDKIIVDLKERPAQKAGKDAVMVDVWSYKDLAIQAEQLAFRFPRTYKAAISVTNGYLFRLEHRFQRIDDFRGWNDDVMLVSEQKISQFDGNAFSDTSLGKRFFLLSINAQTFIPLEQLRGFKGIPEVSPLGKFVVYYDYVSRSVKSYEIASRITRQLTNGITADWTQDSERPLAEWFVNPCAGWTPGDSLLFLNDRHGLWLVDPLGKKTPHNFTKSPNENLVFRLRNADSYREPNVVKERDVLLVVFDNSNKQNGFYHKEIGSTSAPVLLTMGPYLYNISGNRWTSDYNFPVLKAPNAGMFIVQRMSATQAPNLFSTEDFVRFRQLSQIHPESKYNWLTSELHSWKTLDGKKSQGVLYKPANFDRSKKYPVIFYYYERLSELLNAYIQPEYSWGGLFPNISWYVSNGYLVFCPDIHYTAGYIGDNAVNSVTAAAKYLMKFSFVDGSKMGLQGHSFGGFETNYIITHSKMFSAACTAAGVAEQVSLYNSASNSSRQDYHENQQGRFGGTLWQKKDAYLRNSPVLFADRITTPLLLMHNKGDMNVPFTQGLEMFLALRRLGKPGWLLQYDNGGHSIYRDREPQDFTLRMWQFFDHFLKGAPAPEWMTKGVPASMKGIVTGYTSDPSGQCSKDCKICMRWNKISQGKH